MKRTIIAVSLLLAAGLVVAIIYGLRGSYDARAHRAACHRANLEKLNSLEPLTVTINTEVQEIQRDQDVIDRLDEGTDDDTVIQRRNRVIDGVRLKLTKVNKDRAESQRRTEQIQAELSSCLAEVE